jgi:hypothetical protein
MSTLPRPLCISDRQLSQITAAAAVIAPSDRGAFLGELHALLRHERELGDGVVDRAIRLSLRRFFRPPVVKNDPPSYTRRNVGEPIA